MEQAAVEAINVNASQGETTVHTTSLADAQVCYLINRSNDRILTSYFRLRWHDWRQLSDTLIRC